MRFSLIVYLPIHLSFMSICFSLSLSVSVFFNFIFLSALLCHSSFPSFSVRLFVSPLYLDTNLKVHSHFFLIFVCVCVGGLFVCVCVCVCLSVSLSISLSVCLPVSLSLTLCRKSGNDETHTKLFKSFSYYNYSLPFTFSVSLSPFHLILNFVSAFHFILFLPFLCPSFHSCLSPSKKN
jgi:hypothetical protein